MNDSALTRFFGVVARPQTWLGILFHVLAFPLGLFYFVFLVTGLSVGVGLVVVWVGIPILLVVAGAWWLFGAFERLQAHYLLGADVPPAPREWEKVDGVWGKLKAHFGSGATWMDLLYLLRQARVRHRLVHAAGDAVSMVGWFLAIPFAWFSGFDLISWSTAWVPPLWSAGVLAVPLGILAFFVSLHVLNGWSWVCARWAEVMFARPRPSPGALAPPALVRLRPAGAARQHAAGAAAAGPPAPLAHAARPDRGAPAGAAGRAGGAPAAGPARRPTGALHAAGPAGRPAAAQDVQERNP